MPTCPACRVTISAHELVAGCARHWPGIRALEFACPRCGETATARLEPGRVHFGHVYAAGSPHFSADEVQPVPELSAVWRDGADLVARVGDREWRITAPAD